jgi:hypothetical protein
MASMIRKSLLAVAILAAPVAAYAQSNPTGNLGSNESTAATRRTANSPTSTIHAGDAAAIPKMPPAVDRNPQVPGATGRTVVKGANSTIAGDRAETASEKANTLTK